MLCTEKFQNSDWVTCILLLGRDEFLQWLRAEPPLLRIHLDPAALADSVFRRDSFLRSYQHLQALVGSLLLSIFIPAHLLGVFRKTQAHTHNSRVASTHTSSRTEFSLEGWCSSRARAASGWGRGTGEEPDAIQEALASLLGIKTAEGGGAAGSWIPALVTPWSLPLSSSSVMWGLASAFTLSCTGALPGEDTGLLTATIASSYQQHSLSLPLICLRRGGQSGTLGQGSSAFSHGQNAWQINLEEMCIWLMIPDVLAIFFGSTEEDLTVKSYLCKGTLFAFVLLSN